MSKFLSFHIFIYIFFITSIFSNLITLSFIFFLLCMFHFSIQTHSPNRRHISSIKNTLLMLQILQILLILIHLKLSIQIYIFLKQIRLLISSILLLLNQISLLRRRTTPPIIIIYLTSLVEVALTISVVEHMTYIHFIAC